MSVALLTGFAGNVVRAQHRLLQDERTSGLTQAERIIDGLISHIESKQGGTN